MLATTLSAVLLCQFGFAPPAKPPVKGERIARGWHASQGDVLIVIGVVEVDRVALRGFDGRIRWSALPHLNIYFGVYNHSKARKVNYESVSDGRFARLASMTDDIGNSYKHVTFGASEPALQSKSQSIYPGNFVDDLFVFEEPVDVAKRLTLTISAESLEMEADVIFEIDTKDIKGTAAWRVANAQRLADEKRRLEKELAERKRQLAEEEAARERRKAEERAAEERKAAEEWEARQRRLKEDRAEHERRRAAELEAERQAEEAERRRRIAEEAAAKRRRFDAITAKFEVIPDPFGKEGMIGVRVTVSNTADKDAFRIVVELRDSKSVLDRHKVARVRGRKTSTYVARVLDGTPPTGVFITRIRDEAAPDPPTPKPAG